MSVVEAYQNCGQDQARQKYVRRSQLWMAHSGVKTNAKITLVLIVPILYLLYPLTHTIELAFWILCIAVVSVLRIIISRRAELSSLNDDVEIAHYQRLLIAPLVTLAFLWSAPVVILVRGATSTEQFFVSLMICSVILGSLATLAVWRAVYLVFAFTCMNLMALALIWRHETTLLIPLFLFMFQPVLFAASKLISKTYLQSLYSRYDNEQLTRAATEGKEKAEEIARELSAEIDRRKEAQAQIEQSERRFATLANTMEVGVIVYRDRILYANPASERLIGYTEDELKTMDVWDLLIEEDRAQARQFVMKRIDGHHEKVAFESRLAHQNGSSPPIHVSSGLTHYDNQPAGIAAIIDISARKKAEEALQREKTRIEVTLESIGDGVISTDDKGAVTYLNLVAAKILDVEAEATHGKRIQNLLHLSDHASSEPVNLPDENSWGREELDALLNGQELLLQRPDESYVPVAVTVTSLQGEATFDEGVVLVLRDETEVRSLTQLMIYQASHDPLTSLINRREFEQRLNDLLTTKTHGRAEHILFYMDLDQFKVINDTCGHMAGDQLLMALGDLLQDIIRETDTLARLGGDEFAVILPFCPLPIAQSIAEKIVDAVKEYRFTWDGRLFEVGISIGIVPIEEGSHLQDLLSAADTACYIAKDQGRNSIQVYQKDNDLITQRRGQMNWMHRLQRALKEDRFQLYLQEIHATSEADTCRYRGELLLRKVSEDGTLIPPGQFITAAERYQLMPEIDRWVLRASFEAISHFCSKIKDESLYGINISGQSLVDQQFLSFVLDLFNEFSVNFNRICFEVTETAAITNIDQALIFLKTLREKGCCIALDDFGSGVSSFGYLKYFPVDYLKIDGRFVREVLNSPKDLALVNSMSQVGKVLGIKTIAEHVEDQKTLDTLRGIGIDYVQGVGVHRPQSLYEWLNYHVQGNH